MNSRTVLLVVVCAILSAAGGWWAASRNMHASGQESESAGAGPCAGGSAPSYWKAPMDPTYVRNQPGKSPMGMDLVPVCSGGAGDDPTQDGIQVASSTIQSMGVRTARVTRGDISRSIRAVGRVTYDERLISHVHTKIQGWIEKLEVEYEGQAVEAGARMLEIYSPELVSTQEELLEAAKYRDRIAQSGFPDVREGGEGLFEATRQRLELWDIAEQDIDRLLRTGAIRKTVALYAPASGVVTEIMARQGMEIGPNMNLYTIADLSHVWIYADIYEYEIPWVEVGQAARVELRNMPGSTFPATVTYIYPFLDPKTRTVRIRLELDNPDGLLKPDMYANVVLESETRRGALVIPEEAVIRSGKRNLVIEALGQGRFAPRDVELGVSSGEGTIEILEGLSEEQMIVTSGQFLIDSESNLQEAVAKLLATEEETDAHAGHAMPGMDHADAESMPSEVEHEDHVMPDTHPGAGASATPPMGATHGNHDMPGMDHGR